MLEKSFWFLLLITNIFTEIEFIFIYLLAQKMQFFRKIGKVLPQKRSKYNFYCKCYLIKQLSTFAAKYRTLSEPKVSERIGSCIDFCC